jgi:hypothetical protein
MLDALTLLSNVNVQTQRRHGISAGLMQNLSNCRPIFLSIRLMLFSASKCDPARLRSNVSWWRLDCLAGHVRFELRNVGANYPFERSHGFPGIKPNSDHRDYSRLSCDVGIRSSGLAGC